MSDAVMVPTLRDAAQAVVDRWDTPLWKDVEPTAHVIARLRQALAASTPVGGWEDISTAPKDGVEENDLSARLLGRAQFCRDRGEVKTPELLEQAAAMLSVPPPPSVSTGSRPQEAVPTEQAEPAVVGDDGWIECPACDGSGKIVEAATTTGANQHSACQRDCEDCWGSGRILPQTEKGS